MSIIKSLNSKKKQAKATSKKISLPTQVITPNQKADITQKEQAPQQAQLSLAEQRRQLEEAIKD